MRIVGIYPFNCVEHEFRQQYEPLVLEVEQAIRDVDASLNQTKISREKTMPGRTLYNPVALNKAFASEFAQKGWQKLRVRCEYSREFYVEDSEPVLIRQAYREMDFIKNRLGVEVQFGKYAFMVYNVCAKMTIFRNLGHIEAGIEIVPVKSFAEQMSTGVSYFEQFVWDLQRRGIADIDVPVLIFGVR